MSSALHGPDKGWLLIGSNAAKEPGLWFIFHHGPEGTLALDLTTRHPDIDYALFENALHFKRPKSLRPAGTAEDIVLLGGPENPGHALIILYQSLQEGAHPDSHQVNADFSFLSYTLKILPGAPPTVAGSNDAPTRLKFKPETQFIVGVGFRRWEGGVIEAEIAARRWFCLPASSQAVFCTPHDQRRAKALQGLN